MTVFSEEKESLGPFYCWGSNSIIEEQGEQEVLAAPVARRWETIYYLGSCRPD